MKTTAIFRRTLIASFVVGLTIANAVHASRVPVVSHALRVVNARKPQAYTSFRIAFPQRYTYITEHIRVQVFLLRSMYLFSKKKKPSKSRDLIPKTIETITITQTPRLKRERVKRSRLILNRRNK